jgi:hypothetical protein
VLPSDSDVSDAGSDIAVSDSDEDGDDEYGTLAEVDYHNEVGDERAPASKRIQLLCPIVGITNANEGISAGMCGVLHLWDQFATRAQTVNQPVSHRMAGEVRLMTQEIRIQFICGTGEIPGEISGAGYRDFPLEYKAWRDATLDGNNPQKNVELVRRIDSVIERFADAFLESFHGRLRDGGTHSPSNPHKLSLWDLLQALELADPTSQPNVLPSPKTWAAVEMLCDRFELDFGLVRRQIQSARTLGAELNEDDKALAKSNLLCLVKDLETRRRWTAFSAYFDFVRVCFTTLVTSVIVEALFSQYDAMKGKGNKSRSSLTDEHTLEALLTREAEDVVGDVMCRFEGAPRLGFAAAEQRLEW